jgi:succinate-acetate transporter protein
MNGSLKKTSHIAMPWVLGLYALGGGTFVIATAMAGWYGGPGSPPLLMPFVAVFGGLAQFLAGMWAYAADDVLATAMLGTWGSFWMGYGLLTVLVTSGRLAMPEGAFPELAFWFIAVAAVTWIGAVAATRQSSVLLWVFGLFAIAATIAAIATGFGLHALSVLAGWVFAIGSVVAWYGASAMLLNETFDREVLPVGFRLEPATGPRSVAGQAAEGTAARRAG